LCREWCFHNMKRTLLIAVIVLAVASLVGPHLRRSKAPHMEIVSTDVDEPVPSANARGLGQEFKPLRPRTAFTSPATNPLPVAAAPNSVGTNEFTVASNHVVEVALVETNSGRQGIEPKEMNHWCLSNINEIVWAANAWAAAHRIRYLPGDLLLLTNELSSPLLLLCPSDPEWQAKATTNWHDFNPEWITYRMSRKAMAGDVPVNVSIHYLYCPVHRHWQFGDPRFPWIPPTVRSR
jgi:hypothetical protein